MNHHFILYPFLDDSISRRVVICDPTSWDMIIVPWIPHLFRINLYKQYNRPRLHLHCSRFHHHTHTCWICSFHLSNIWTALFLHYNYLVLFLSGFQLNRDGCRKNRYRFHLDRCHHWSRLMEILLVHFLSANYFWYVRIFLKSLEINLTLLHHLSWKTLVILLSVVGI